MPYLITGGCGFVGSNIAAHLMERSEDVIVFDNLSFRYSSTSPWVLNKINISIKTGEKVIITFGTKHSSVNRMSFLSLYQIGIVGRTGAGKSTIIQSLFRMAELDGRILIDGIDTAHIPLYDLRRHISIIPQVNIFVPSFLNRCNHTIEGSRSI